MDDPSFMCGLQRLGDLFRDRERFVEWNRSRQRAWALDQLHHERLHLLSCAVRSVRVFEPVEMWNLGMIQRSGHLCLPLEASQAFGIAGEAPGKSLIATAG